MYNPTSPSGVFDLKILCFESVSFLDRKMYLVRLRVVYLFHVGLLFLVIGFRLSTSLDRTLRGFLSQDGERVWSDSGRSLGRVGGGTWFEALSLVRSLLGKKCMKEKVLHRDKALKDEFKTFRDPVLGSVEEIGDRTQRAVVLGPSDRHCLFPSPGLNA